MRLLLLISLLSIVNAGEVFQSCSNVHGRNLTDLQGVWEVHQNNNDSSTSVYYISLCNSLPNSICDGGSTVCKKQQSTGLSFGKFDKPPDIAAASETAVSFYLEYNTTRNCTTRNGVSYSYRSSITFECSTTLGSPEVISSDECSVDFLWETSKVCRPSEYDAIKEVRCYGYDSNDKKRDLNSLIKQMGGYFVTDPNSNEKTTDGLYINVCRDIKSVRGDKVFSVLGNCPSGSAACLVKGGHSYSLGVPGSEVNVTKQNRLVLAYQFSPQPGNTKPPECGSFTPQVIVTFVCPGNTRGGSKPPILTSTLNCQYTIEWWTEAACPADFVRSKTCQLDIQKHGIELDLAPLTKKTQYEVATNDNQGTTYFLNVCGGIHVACSANQDPSTQNDVAVCQSNNNGAGYNAGSSSNYQLQYVDEELSITYKNGQRCNSNGLRRRSVIIFHCNKTAGIGKPTFSHELHCTYYFDWQTANACTSQPVCHLTDSQGQTFDLSSLTKINGGGEENWEVLRTDVIGVSHINAPRYFINVCGEILRDRVTTPCPPGAAVCRLKSSQHVSFGSYAHYNITRQNNKLVMFYSNGDVCPETGVGRTTKITLYCRPGDLEGSPVFKYMSSDGCQLALSWYTAAACPLKAVTGTNCMVSDEESGLTFDLRRLTKSAKDNMYKVSTNQYDYFLNVCDKLANTPCNSATGDSPGTCQVELGGSGRSFTTGQASETLTYYNGFVKLLYENGDSYSNHLHNRSTQISFLCDTKVGAGKPQYVSEGNFTYLFNWYTSYVCPAASVQCMVTDPTTGEQYDLSSLAKSEDDEDANWSVMAGTEGEQTRKKKYYLNVCRPVNEVRGNQEMECDALAGVCQTSIDSNGQERIDFPSLGRPTSAPVIERSGHLLLTYTNGSECTDGGVRGSFSTHIHFICEKGVLASSPRFLESTGCSASFMWNTEAACAITSNKGVMNNTECEVSSSNSQYTFNLQPLKRDPARPYVISGGGTTYEINVCGNVSDCGTGQSSKLAGCKKISDGNYQQRVQSHSAPSYSDDGNLYIQYTTTKRNTQLQFEYYKISFICNRTVARGNPTFNSLDGNYVLFDFQTSLACQPEPVDCLVTDEFGNQFDLTPLSQSDKPWIVVNDAKGRTFYLSVCRPLPPVHGCSGSGSGACFVEKVANGGQVKGHNLGLVQSNPSAASDVGHNSAVTLTYMGGDVCAYDTKRRYSTRILFQCSDDEGASPVLQPNGDPCEFLFAWHTPAACPVTKVKGQGCNVTDPLYHMTFDLSQLTKSSTDYVVPAGNEYNFNINICSALNQATGKCQGSGSCQVAKSGGTMYDAGKPSSELVYDDGVITLEYLHGQSCHKNKFERSTVFRFTCNHEDNAASSNGLPTFINETSDCTYHFDWPTAKVCPPIKIVGCTATHALGDQYDLSALSLSDSNYLASTRGDTGGRSYYINVCRSLLHQPGVTCPPNSAACMKQGKKYTSLGTVTDGPEFNGDTLRLVYTGGDRCASDPKRNYSTVVTFQCGQDSAVDTTPVVVSGDSCIVQMLWVTKAACALNTPSGGGGSSSGAEGGSTTSGKPCVAINPATGHSFDMSSLTSSSGYEVDTYVGHYFNINVCEKLHGGNCPDGTGSCLATQHNGPYISAGQASSQLTLNSGALSLHYSNGATCDTDNKYKQSTTISFVCHRSTAPHLQQPNEPATSPVYVGEEKETCSYYFSWHTHLACEIQNPCAAISMDGVVPKIYDLSSLISESGHYMAVGGEEGNRTVYFINVCRPLEPISGINCPAGASVCAAKHGSKPKSLGYIDPKKRHLTYKNGSVVLEYGTGITCPTDGSANVSTRIMFTCMPNAGKGVPLMTAVTVDCVYLFEWPTAVVCLDGQKVTENTDQCKFTDPRNDFVYDLSQIKPIDIATSSGHYRLSPCQTLASPPSACKDSSACRIIPDGTSYSIGKSSTRNISNGENQEIPVQITYTGGDKCRSSSNAAKTTILFRCDRSENEPTMIPNGATCRYLVYWPTPHVCPPPVKSCVATDPQSGTTYDLSLLSSMTHAWTFQDKDKNRYYLNLCRNVPESNCNENATFCRKLKSTKAIQNIGVVSTQSITVQSKNKVLVRYSKGGTGICTDPDKSASVEISFTCSPSVSALPTFDRISQEDCVFHINWQTRIACADEPEKVTVDNSGKFVDPKSGATINLSTIINKSWTATGDLRQDNGQVSHYEYAINMNGQSGGGKCEDGTTVCQYKLKDTMSRIVGGLQPPPVYTMADESLEILFKSNDRCGRDTDKRSHSLLTLRCSGNKNIGQPKFVYESMECGYFFEWYTSAMCVDMQQISPSQNPTPAFRNQTDVHEVQDKHNNSTAVVVVVFSSLALVCILILVFHNAGRRRSFSRSVKKIFGFGSSPSNYRYIRGSDDEDGTGLFDDMDDLHMQQETSLLGGGQRMHGATNTGGSTVPLASIGGAAVDNDTDDLFAVPDVSVKSSKRGKAPKPQKGKTKKKRQNPNPFEESDSDDLLPFLKDKKPPKSRAPGVGGEKKVETYHDDDDEDLLEG